MNINQGKHSESVAPYNEIYDAFEPLFLSLFQQRSVHNQSEEIECYVPMLQVEARLKNFVQSESSEICLFVGSIGIGKSSILRHLSSTTWGNTKKTETIYHWQTTALRCVPFGVFFPKETRRESEIEFKDF
jgi:hypothetical protein